MAEGIEVKLCGHPMGQACCCVPVYFTPATEFWKHPDKRDRVVSWQEPREPEWAQWAEDPGPVPGPED